MTPETSRTPSESFWTGKKVFLTGHTGFKGGWLSIWLQMMGAEVFGYALEPPTEPSLFKLGAGICVTRSVFGDIRDADRLCQAMQDVEPEIVFHMAAQPLVRESYRNPVTTFSTNVMGTVNLMEAVRNCGSVRAVVNVTTDKCYENPETGVPFREIDPLGGADPYSSSKACSELVTAAWRSSFFNPADYARHQVAVATARAGNVIGGGDWAMDRLVPDIFRALLAGESVRIRNPHAVRPWQHVLEPLSGYLSLAQSLFEQGSVYGESWNFGPAEGDAMPVLELVGLLCDKWGAGARYEIDSAIDNLHEAFFLKLDTGKAEQYLAWHPRLCLEKGLDLTVEWYQRYIQQADMITVCKEQIEHYLQ